MRRRTPGRLVALVCGCWKFYVRQADGTSRCRGGCEAPPAYAVFAGVELVFERDTNGGFAMRAVPVAWTEPYCAEA